MGHYTPTYGANPPPRSTQMVVSEMFHSGRMKQASVLSSRAKCLLFTWKMPNSIFNISWISGKQLWVQNEAMLWLVTRQPLQFSLWSCHCWTALLSLVHLLQEDRKPIKLLQISKYIWWCCLLSGWLLNQAVYLPCWHLSSFFAPGTLYFTLVKWLTGAWNTVLHN